MRADDLEETSSQLRHGTPSFPPTQSAALGSHWDPTGSLLLQTLSPSAGGSGRDKTPAKGMVLGEVVGVLVRLGLLKSLSEGPKADACSPDISGLEPSAAPGARCLVNQGYL